MLNNAMHQDGLSRKNFIKLLGVGLTSLGINPKLQFNDAVKFPDYERLGRVCVGGMIEIKSQPYSGSQTVGVLYEDAVVPWLRESAAKEPGYSNFYQRWVETTDGYIFAADLQPVKNLPNNPVATLMTTSSGHGMWAEVTVPYADVTLVNSPSSNTWVHYKIDKGLPLRVYYGQVYFIDQIKSDEHGNSFYRINPNYYGGLDLMWVSAEVMRPIYPEELTTINPLTENKKIVVNIDKQSLSCYEDDIEVFYCLVSTGWYDRSEGPGGKWGTPLGTYLISRKYISLQMSGGTSGAPYDLPGIGWVSIFATGGIAIHATVWHNDFGADPKSHGCVNALPQDAKWIFRWSLPQIAYDSGMLDITETGAPSTTVQVIES